MIDVRPLTADDADAALNVSITALLSGRLNPAELADRRRYWGLAHSLGAFDGDRLIGHARAIGLETTVPGGRRVPTAGISSVGVLPTDTRRGVLRALKTTQMAYERAAGMVLASLRASEAPIYGRFGYGLAGMVADYEIDRRSGAFTDAGAALAGAGEVRLIDPVSARQAVPEVYERAAQGRPGAIGRIEPWWERLYRTFGGDDDTSARWVVVHCGSDGLADAYVDYERPKDGQVIEVRDLFAASIEGYAALWRYLLDLDLATIIRATYRPVDEPLRWLLRDARALQVTKVTDEQWVRLLDVEAALSARTYGGGDDAVVVAIDDPFFVENCGHYRVAGQGATRAEDDSQPDLSLGIADAGAVYLGGTAFVDLVAAGRVVEHRSGAAAAADRLFGTRPLPWCGTFF